MKILDDRVLNIIMDYHPRLKKICHKLNLKSADEIKNFLNDKNETYKEERLMLKIELSSVEFFESFSSTLLYRGIESTSVDDFEEVKAIKDLMEDNFWGKIERIKNYCVKRNIDFETLPFDKKLLLFEDTIILENDVIKDAFRKMLYRVFSKTQNQTKEIEQYKLNLKNFENLEVEE